MDDRPPKVIDGIRQRLDPDYFDDSDRGMPMLRKLFAKNGLPFDEWDPSAEMIALGESLYELIQRWSDAAENDQRAEAVFIERQMDALLVRAREQFSKR